MDTIGELVVSKATPIAWVEHTVPRLRTHDAGRAPIIGQRHEPTPKADKRLRYRTCRHGMAVDSVDVSSTVEVVAVQASGWRQWAHRVPGLDRPYLQGVPLHCARSTTRAGSTRPLRRSDHAAGEAVRFDERTSWSKTTAGSSTAHTGTSFRRTTSQLWPYR